MDLLVLVHGIEFAAHLALLGDEGLEDPIHTLGCMTTTHLVII